MHYVHQIEVYNSYNDTGQCKAILLTELLLHLQAEGAIKYKQVSKDEGNGCKEHFEISFHGSSIINSWLRLDFLLCAMYDKDYKFQPRLTVMS